MTAYRDYYARCQAAWRGGDEALGLYALGVHVVTPGRSAPDDPVRLGDEYLDAVEQVDAEVQRRIAGGEGLYRNADARVQELAVQLEPFWDFEPLERVAACLVPQVERTVLGCDGVVNQINLIRSLPSASPPASSWLWHYDNNPDEAFKILVYLTDVSEHSGAFEYLRRSSGEVPKIPSSRAGPDRVGPPRWPGSRIPADVLAAYEEDGYRPARAVGPRGTAIVFDNNCVHRATVPSAGHRDALILNIRPSHAPVRPYISRRHTGSWSFNVKQWIPESLEIAAAV